MVDKDIVEEELNCAEEELGWLNIAEEELLEARLLELEEIL